MISPERFLALARDEARRDLARHPQQRDAVTAARDESLFLVAGPGTGKTTVLALRVLKLVFVDDIDPGNIVATTFTRRAAAELRSRILGWGDRFRNACRADAGIAENILANIERLDLNRLVTGTLDSIAEAILGDYCPPGTQPPIVVEEFVSSAFMLRDGLFAHNGHRSPDLRAYVTGLRGSAFGLNTPEMGRVVLEIRERIIHDRVDAVRYQFDPRPGGQAPPAGVAVTCTALDAYINKLQCELVLDFAALEQQFLLQMRNGALNRFLESAQVILVDEYQDTNLLQEEIYFELTRAAVAHGGGLTVVGDDDQSLYRFRGATVDLFQAFPQRALQVLNINPRLIYLAQNYRSTNTIVDFVNNFATLDRRYQAARVAGKPPLVSSRQAANPNQPVVNYPVLGLFRDDVAQLGRDLARCIVAVSQGPGFRFNAQGHEFTIQTDRQQGNISDCAFLCSSPRELDFSGRPRLPLLLRQQLQAANPPMDVFNPRGQELATLRDVQILCGLILECIDPQSLVQRTIQRLPVEVTRVLATWRATAQAYAATNPNPQIGNWPPVVHSLADFVNAWQARRPQRAQRWERRTSLVDLAYKLVTWIPNFQNDIEGLVYLEAIARTITEAARFSSFGSEIVFSTPELVQRSTRSAIWDIFVPLASGAIDIDEDLLETLPRDRLNILSIHQAKGLEFPFVIVDVGSDFRTNHHTQAFKRFPRNGGGTCSLEDELRPFSPLGVPHRSALDRAFDDLSRHYFVAYSRAQDVLLLVGLNSVRQSIPNIATGWDRAARWHWSAGLPNLVHI